MFAQYVKQYPSNKPQFTYMTNEADALAKIHAGLKPDLFRPYVGWVKYFATSGLVQPWDPALISNFKHLNPFMVKAGQYGGKQSGIPDDWGFDAILYRSDKVKPKAKSWGLLFDERYKGKIAWYDDITMIQIAGLYLGFKDTWNQTDAQLKQSQQLLKSKKHLVRLIWSSETNLWEAFGSGDVWIAYAWPNDWVQMKAKKVNVVYMRPRELPMAWLVVFFVVPIAIVAAYSFDVYSLFPGPHGFTTAAWRAFAHDHVYLLLFWKSVKMSLVVSALIVVLAYPLAYYLALSGTKRKYILLLVLIAPFLTSYLLRVLAWKVILGDQGVVNTFLFRTGLRSADHPISQLLYSRFAVMLVLGYVWLPFVALPIFVSLESLDRRLLEAASDLGASRLQAFRKVTLPLSLPGIMAAFLFVFIPTLGEFVTPSLVGGANGYMYGNQIVDLFGTGFPDWETGSVLALFVFGVVTVLTVVFTRFLQPRQVTAG